MTAAAGSRPGPQDWNSAEYEGGSREGPLIPEAQQTVSAQRRAGTCALDVVVAAFELLERLLAPAILALFDLTCDPPRLVLSNRLGQRVLDRMAGLSAESRRRLAAGVAETGGTSGDYVLLPCHDQQQLAAVVYVEPPQRAGGWARRHVLALTVLLAGALRLASSRSADGHGEPAIPRPEQASERVALELLLERHEWNVSRVARVLGVTRMTVYNRLRRFAVPRQRVPKRAGRRP